MTIYNPQTSVVKATSKGQITLPVSWRRKFKTDCFLIKQKESALEIKPLDLRMVADKSNDEYTVFDAIRDNRGKGIKATDLAKAIKKTL